MIDVLLVGLSRFARKRVLPALAGLDEVATIHVATRGGTDADLAAVPRRGRVFRDYAEALAQSPRGLVYVSLTNDAHAHWVERALELGHHVIVDKPAFVDLPTAERQVALAAARGCVLAEATAWTFHPVVAQLRALFAQQGLEPRLVTAGFTAPIAAGDYRMRRASGGGALLDLGPYAASLGRALWGAEPAFVCARVNDDNGEVDTSFSMLADYGGGRSIVGHFGFNLEYRNWIHLAAAGLAVEVHGAFSVGPGIETEIVIRRRDVITMDRARPAFAMQRFLADVLAAIARGDTASHAATLLADARVRAQLA